MIIMAQKVHHIGKLWQKIGFQSKINVSVNDAYGVAVTFN